MRHDIDMSLEKAYRFALIENELGIKASYFIHLHSEYYHFFERDSAQIILKIKELGHNLALHFDTHYYNINSEKELNDHIKREAKLLRDFFDIESNVFSFHNTNSFVMSCKKLRYANLINTYAKVFQTELPYCSDSYGVWRFERLIDIVKNKKYRGLQILTHPELWSDEPTSPYERIMDVIEKRASVTKYKYDNLLASNNREKIDWE
jgi:peptidoglycan/xylan/chitin deacetylase (PgdA/CDA1 family)